jgi:dihydrofolate reductase
MRPLRYSINVTLDGCVDHTVGTPDAESHKHHADNLARADALIFGRVTYEMMLVWRDIARGHRPDGVPDWTVPFAKVIDAAKKYVVSDSLASVDWNAELIRGADLERTVRQLKQQPGEGLALGGVTLPLALAGMGLIDEYEFVVQPRLAGHGPYLFAGLSQMVDLKQVGRREFGSGTVATRYEPTPQSR